MDKPTEFRENTTWNFDAHELPVAPLNDAKFSHRLNEMKLIRRGHCNQLGRHRDTVDLGQIQRTPLLVLASYDEMAII